MNDRPAPCRPPLGFDQRVYASWRPSPGPLATYGQVPTGSRLRRAASGWRCVVSPCPHRSPGTGRQRPRPISMSLSREAAIGSSASCLTLKASP